MRGAHKLSHGGITFMKKNYRISPRISKDADKVKPHHPERPVAIHYCQVDHGKFTALELLNKSFHWAIILGDDFFNLLQPEMFLDPFIGCFTRPDTFYQQTLNTCNTRAW
jgi:hypothetical protein